MCSALLSCFVHCLRRPREGFLVQKVDAAHYPWEGERSLLVVVAVGPAPVLPSREGGCGIASAAHSFGRHKGALAAIGNTGRNVTEWNLLKDLMSLICFPHMFPRHSIWGCSPSPDRYWKPPHKSQVTLQGKKIFSDCVGRISSAKPCYSYLKLGKLAISAEFQSRCREGRSLKHNLQRVWFWLVAFQWAHSDRYKGELSDLMISNCTKRRRKNLQL